MRLLPARLRLALLLLSPLAVALAQEPQESPAPETGAEPQRGSQMYPVDPDAYSIVSQVKGLSFHKPMYVMPVSYSPTYHGSHTEMLYQISAKYRLFGTQFYLAYSQKSFWQPYNAAESSPFRETDYNPEAFYRWVPDPQRFHHWGGDFGFEHESNGRALPDSRSWNRIYAAAFQARGRQLLYAKFWYRIPEDPKAGPDDARGDDNPDIESYYGYGELRWQRQVGGKQVVSAMVRGNPVKGHGALELTWSIPTPGDYAFFGITFWQGYGESLIDYNHNLTRISAGVFFSR